MPDAGHFIKEADLYLTILDTESPVSGVYIWVAFEKSHNTLEKQKQKWFHAEKPMCMGCRALFMM